jgi:hypothetical protein
VAAQTVNENCVAHNGSLVPVPGRDILVHAWYQGGLSLIDFTDSGNPTEIAFFDRGPVSGEQLARSDDVSSKKLKAVRKLFDSARKIADRQPRPPRSCWRPQRRCSAAGAWRARRGTPCGRPRSDALPWCDRENLWYGGTHL